MKKGLLLSFLLLFVCQLYAADYYWVGGSGNWRDINHWATTSGGSTFHSIVPGPNDNVIFDANSGLTDSDIIDLPEGNAFCHNMSWVGVTTTPIFRNPEEVTIYISGSLELSSTVRYAMHSIEFTSNSDATLTTNGAARLNIAGWYNPFVVNKPGGSLTVLDAIPENLQMRTIVLTNGHLDLSGNDHFFRHFRGSNSNIRSVDISNSVITMTGTWDFRGANSTLTSDGSYIKTVQFHSDGHEFEKVDISEQNNTGTSITGTVFGELTFTNTVSSPGTLRIGGNNTIERLEFKSSGLLRAGGNIIEQLIVAPGFDLMVFGTNTITTLFQLNTPNCSGLGSITGNSGGTLNFQAGATIDLQNVYIQNMTATGGVTLPINVSGADGGGNSGWAFQSPATGTTLYWVGGSGDWNDRNHWSASSGGPGGFCVPFISDNVVFDQNSGFAPGNNTVTTTSNTWCKDMTWDNVPATPTFNVHSSYKMELWGDLVMDPTVTMNSKLQFSGDQNATIQTNGSSLGEFHVRVEKSTGDYGVTLVDDFINPLTNIDLSTGQWLMPGRSITVNSFNSGSGQRTIDITNATIDINEWRLFGNGRTWVGNGAGSSLTVHRVISVRDLEYPKIEFTGDVSTLDIANSTFGELTFTNPSPTSLVHISSGNTIETLEFKGAGLIGENNNINNLLLAPSMEYFFTGTNTIENSLQFLSPSCDGLGEMRGYNGLLATLVFATGATVDMDNVYLQNMSATGSGVPIAVNGADAGGNNGFTISSSSSGARYWVGGSGDWNDSNNWSTTSGGPAGACVPTVENDVFFDVNSFTGNGNEVTVASGNAYSRNMDWTGASGNPIFSKDDLLDMEIWGDLIMNPQVTMNSNTRLQLTGPNSTTINTNGSTLGDFDFSINKANQSTIVTLLDDMSNSQTRIELLRGGLDLSERSVSIEAISDLVTPLPTSIDISNAILTLEWSYTGSQKSLTATGSEITAKYFHSNGGVYDKVDVTTGAVSNINIANSSFTQLIFSNTSTSSSARISGGNTIDHLEFKGPGFINGSGNTIETLVFSPGKIYSLLSGSTNTITGEWFGSGTPCNLTEISSNSTANATITKPTGTVEFDYIRLKGITADSPTPFVANEHSVDQGGNLNWDINPYNGSAPITGLGPDLALNNDQLPYTLTTDGFFGSPLSQYTWIKDGNVIGTGDELIISDEGTYSVMVNFVDGCEVSDDIVITFASTDLAIVKTVDNPTADINSDVVFTLVASNNGPAIAQGVTVNDQLPTGYTYVSSTAPTGTTYDQATGIWTIGDLTLDTEVTMTITATVNSTGSYTNIATIIPIGDDPDNSNNSSEVTIIPGAPAVVTQPSCELETGTIEMQLLTDATYSIDGGATFTASNIFPDLPPGEYILVSKIGELNSAPEYVTINEPPVGPDAPESGGDQLICATTPISTLTATALVPAGQTITWYDAPSGGNVVSNPELSTIGSITYYAEADNGTCVSETRTAVQLEYYPEPVLSIQDPAVACAPTTIDLTAPEITNGNPDDLDLSYFQDESLSTPVATPTTINVSGTYYIQGTSKTTGCSVVATVNVQFVDKPEVEVVHPDCVIATGSITITSPLGAGFEYSIDNGVTYSQDIAYENLTPGTYQVLASNTALPGCISEVTTVVINATPTTAVPIVHQPNCGDTTGSVEFALNSEYEYSINGTAYQSGNIFNLSPGTHSIQSKKIGEPCIADPVIVTIEDAPEIPAPPVATDQVVCQTGTIQVLTAIATVNPGDTITWYDAATGGNTVSSPTLSTIGSVTYYAQSSNDFCSSDTRTPVTLTIRPLPIFDQLTDINSCGEIILPAITGNHLSGNQAYYTQPNGGGTIYQAGDTYNVLGETTLYIFDENVVTTPALSCPTEISFNVNIRETTQGTISGDQSICKDTAPAELISDIDGTGSGVLSYKWEQSTTDATSGFTAIPGATEASFIPGVLNETTYYRRTTVSNLRGVICESAPSAVITITVQNTTAPVFVETLPGSTTASCDAIPAPAILTATDNLGAVTVTYSESTQQGNCSGNYNIVRQWNATNDCGLTNTHIQIINVEDSTAPVFVEALPTDITVSCDAIPMADILTATDNCGTATVSFNETTTAGNCAGNYTLIREWIATDDCGLTTVHTQTINVEDTTAPDFVEALPMDMTVGCDAIPNPVALTATDKCGMATVTFSETTTAGSCPGNYTLIREWIATDDCGLTTVHTQTINVEDTTSPVFVEPLPEDISVGCDQVPNAEVLTATSICSNATVSFNETASEVDSNGGYTLTREWVATDECGQTSQHTQIVTVEDTTAPVFIEPLPENITLDCEGDIPSAVSLNAEDSCSSATVTFNEITTQGDCPGSVIIERTWTATDSNGNQAVHIQIVTVEDNTAPTFNSDIPEDVSVSCNAIPEVPSIIATDNCSDVSIVFNEYQEQANTCSSQYSIIRQWVITDLCGNSTTHTQTIHVTCEIQEEDIHNAVNVGDSTYDNYFKIDKIECFEDNTVRIFNRWGSEVYSVKGYNNEDKAFRGYSNAGSTVRKGQGLPTGNYYYVIEYRYSPDGVNYQTLNQSGFLYINNNN